MPSHSTYTQGMLAVTLGDGPQPTPQSRHRGELVPHVREASSKRTNAPASSWQFCRKSPSRKWKVSFLAISTLMPWREETLEPIRRALINISADCGRRPVERVNNICREAEAISSLEGVTRGVPLNRELHTAMRQSQEECTWEDIKEGANHVRKARACADSRNDSKTLSATSQPRLLLPYAHNHCSREQFGCKEKRDLENASGGTPSQPGPYMQWSMAPSSTLSSSA